MTFIMKYIIYSNKTKLKRVN